MAGCHRPTGAIFPRGVANLDLTPDDLLVARLVNVPATYADIECMGAPCIPASCPSGPVALLLDQANPAASWMLLKTEPFTPGQTGNVDMGCGEAMPSLNTTGINMYSQGQEDCLIEFFTTLGQVGLPCPVSASR